MASLTLDGLQRRSFSPVQLPFVPCERSLKFRTFIRSPSPHLGSLPAVRDVSYADDSSAFAFSSAAPRSSLLRALHPITSTASRPGPLLDLGDASILQMSSPALRGPVGLLLVVPALEQAVQGEDGQGAQDVHDPVLQVQLTSRKLLRSKAALRLASLYLNSRETKTQQFADDTAVVGRIANNDESDYRQEVEHLEGWCRQNNLCINVKKTKEMIVDFRRGRHLPSPLYIGGTAVEVVSSFRYLGVHISDDLTWSKNTSCLIRKAHQRLYFLRRLRRAGLGSSVLTSFYRCVVESVLSSCIIVWHGSCSAAEKKALQRVVKAAQRTVGRSLPTTTDIYTSRCRKRASCIMKDPTHTTHALFVPLPSGRRLRSIKSRTTRLRNSFFPEAVRLLNSGGPLLNKADMLIAFSSTLFVFSRLFLIPVFPLCSGRHNEAFLRFLRRFPVFLNVEGENPPEKKKHGGRFFLQDSLLFIVFVS
ncbi:hypothetical protein L3Q82_000018 [Scortum barcoo]|uniref:Uncharacterized protein n=1 Tax=Scortum barcoo TaxID=214431 RepID=A0ACB8XBM4_9TELE|nr:hypothetical protein L3Q82_000018 [Scortum barcoo]